MPANKAMRQYMWTMLTSNIMNEDPKKFFSEQLKRRYLPPKIRNRFLQDWDDWQIKRKGGHHVINTPYGEMVSPDTFDVKHFERKEKKSLEELKKEEVTKEYKKE